VLWSTSGVFAKSPPLQGWDGLTLAFWRAVFAVAVLTPLIRRPKFTWAMGPMVLSFVVMNATFLTAMTLCEAAAAIWLQQIAPIWVFLGSVLWFGESVRRGDWWMLALGMSGVLVILVFQLVDATSSSTLGVACGVASGVTYAGVILSIRRLREHDSCWLIALNLWATVLLLAPFVFIPAFHGPGPIWPVGSQWLYLAGLGVFQMGVPYVIFAQGLKRIPSHEASGIALLEPLLVPLWVFWAWHDHISYKPPTWATFIGGAVILAGLLIRYWPRSEPQGKGT
jgi:drug/metabolite transporter (DMT)-like permease